MSSSRSAGGRGGVGAGASPPPSRRNGWDVYAALLLLLAATSACAKFGYVAGDRLFDFVNDRQTRAAVARDEVSGLAAERRLTGEKVELDLDRYPKARCLDGTPGAYYVNMANRALHSTLGEETHGKARSHRQATANTWVVMLQGGGECVNAPECAERAGTTRGSSELLPDEIIFDRGIQQVSRVEQETELPFANANMVTIAYCSGDVYVGRATEPDAGGMWHAGSHIVESVLKELVHVYGMDNADVVVLAGRSAGAIGLIAQIDSWADFIRNEVGPVAAAAIKIVGAPYAGFHYFHDDSDVFDSKTDSPESNELTYIPWDETSFKEYISYWRGTKSMPEACVEEHKDKPWKCAVAKTSFPYTRTPLFFTQALTDSVVMHLHDNLNVKGTFQKDEVAFAQEWGIKMRTVLEPVMKHPTAGLFAAACYVHTDFDQITIDGVSHHVALANWVFNNEDVKLMDSCDGLMCNPTCRKREANSVGDFEDDIKTNSKLTSISPQGNDVASVGTAERAIARQERGRARRLERNKPKPQRH